MASPQKENGYTPIANEIMDQIVRLPLSGTQLRILLLVWRYTYGFSRREHDLSDTFIATAIGIDRRNVRREIKELIRLKLLTISKEATFTSPKAISFNKDYDLWERAKLPPGGKNAPEGENYTPPEGELAPSPEGEFTPQDKQIYKTNIKTNEHEQLFESLWKLYPKKKGKGQVGATQKKKLFKIGVEEMTRAIERCNRDKADTDIQYWQNGSTFFNSGYIDYLDKNYTEPEQPRTRGW